MAIKSSELSNNVTPTSLLGDVMCDQHLTDKHIALDCRNQFMSKTTLTSVILESVIVQCFFPWFHNCVCHRTKNKADILSGWIENIEQIVCDCYSSFCNSR